MTFTQVYGVDPYSFREIFQERAPLELLSRDLFNKLLRMYPKKDQLSTAYFIDEEEYLTVKPITGNRIRTY